MVLLTCEYWRLEQLNEFVDLSEKVDRDLKISTEKLGQGHCNKTKIYKSNGAVQKDTKR